MIASPPLYFDTLATPIGDMLVVFDDAERLRALDWTNYRERRDRLLKTHYGLEPASDEARRPAPASLREPLERYFTGDLRAIDAIPVATNGTAFQRRVWDALRAIPAGSTVSYGALARRIGRPKAVRAVGLANGQNPIGIVVPCHRVIGANDALTGYGGGLDRKLWLLRHEGSLLV